MPEPDVDSSAPPERVVVIGPATAANIYALGMGDSVVGVSDYNTITAAANLPRVGGLFDPNHERIAALNPDLVIVQGKARQLEEFCTVSGIEFRSFSTDTIAAWHSELEWLAQRFDAEDAWATQVNRMTAGLEELAEAQNTSNPPRVLLVFSRRPAEASSIVVAGGSSFLSELLAFAGGVNAFPDTSRDYFDLNEESLIRAAPQVIIEFGTDEKTALAVWRESFPMIPAVKDGRVLVISDMDALMPGPSMLETARSLAAALND